VAARVRHAVALSGWLALTLGLLLGLLAVHPQLLTAWLPGKADSLIVALVGMGLTGLLTGAVAGLALRGTSGWMRWSVAVFGVIVGLIVSEMAEGILFGLPPARALTMVSGGLKTAQLGLGILGATIGIQTGRASFRQQAAVGGAAQLARRRPAARPARRAASGATRRQTRRRGAAALSISSVSAQSLPAAGSAPKKRWKGARAARRQVHLGRKTSAMCPYCLEEVKPNDPRGKVVCRICHTPHHADCWAITGKCEVPHLQM
jgi:hypothetical protein